MLQLVELLHGVVVEIAPERVPHTYFSDRFADELSKQTLTSSSIAPLAFADDRFAIARLMSK